MYAGGKRQAANKQKKNQVVYTGQRLFTRFKLHAAAKLRRRFIIAAVFVKWRSSREPDTTDDDVWNSYMRLEPFNEFQEIPRQEADKEAIILVQLIEVRALHITSWQRERQQQLDLDQVMSECEQETKRSDKFWIKQWRCNVRNHHHHHAATYLLLPNAALAARSMLSFAAAADLVDAARAAVLSAAALAFAAAATFTLLARAATAASAAFFLASARAAVSAALAAAYLNRTDGKHNTAKIHHN